MYNRSSFNIIIINLIMFVILILFLLSLRSVTDSILVDSYENTSCMHITNVKIINSDNVVVTAELTNEESTHPYKTLIFTEDTDGMYTVTACEFDTNRNSEEHADSETSKIVGSIRITDKQKTNAVTKMQLCRDTSFVDLWEKIIKSSWCNEDKQYQTNL